MKESEQGDHAWGWVITAAVFGSNCLSVGYYRAFGVFFVEIIDTFQSSTSLTSLIMGVQAAVLSISALIVHNVLLPLVGERRSALVGGLLMASGMALTTFATSVTYLLFSLSFLIGLGNAMTYGPGLVLLGQYFQRRRALAMSVANTGSSVGSMTLPVLASFLLQRYGLSGAWLLYGAVTLHICVFTSLYRPLTSAPQTSRQGQEQSGTDAESSQALLKGEKEVQAPRVEKTTEGCGQTAAVFGSAKIYAVPDLAEDKAVPRKQSPKEGLIDACHGDREEQFGSLPVAEKYLSYLGEGEEAKAFSSAQDVSAGKPLTKSHLHGRRSSTLGDLRFPPASSRRHRHRHPHHHHYSNTSVSTNAVMQRKLIRDVVTHSSHPHLAVTSPSLSSLYQERPTATSTSTSGPKQSETPASRRCGGFWTRVACDGDLLRKPLFWLVQAYVCVGVVGSTGAGVYLPALCQEKGLDKGQTAVVLSTWGALNLAGRLLCGLVADRRWLGPSSISLVSFLLIGLLFQLVRFLPPSLGPMVALAAVYGLFEGAFFTMLPLIIIDFVSLRHFSRTFGFVQLSQGAFATMSYPVLGRLRDVTGDYYATFHCLGACALMASLLLLLESGARALRTARTSEKDLSSSSDDV